MIEGLEQRVVAGRVAVVLGSEGPHLASEADASDLVGAALSAEARLIVIPIERLGEAFLDLKSGLAGAVLQKMVNYRRLPVILGDVSERTANSEALAAFVRESNRGSSVWFVRDLAELEEKLQAGSR